LTMSSRDLTANKLGVGNLEEAGVAVDAVNVAVGWEHVHVVAVDGEGVHVVGWEGVDVVDVVADREGLEVVVVGWDHVNVGDRCGDEVDVVGHSVSNNWRCGVERRERHRVGNLLLPEEAEQAEGGERKEEEEGDQAEETEETEKTLLGRVIMAERGGGAGECGGLGHEGDEEDDGLH